MVELKLESLLKQFIRYLVIDFKLFEYISEFLYNNRRIDWFAGACRVQRATACHSRGAGHPAVKASWACPAGNNINNVNIILIIGRAPARPAEGA